MTEHAAPGTLIMGVVNVTPDSFSDGGRWFDHEAAIRHGLALVRDGAEILDVGGESTRPGAARVETAEEIRRVVPVIRELAGRGIRVSVDTMWAETARAAVDAGAEIVNDVSAGLADPDMVPLVAETGATYVAMHWRGHSDRMDSLNVYGDLVLEVRRELEDRVAALLEAGVDRSKIILDPGLGFSKVGAQNWEVLGRLDELHAIGFPLLVGASRKRFLAPLLPEGSPASDRDLPTAVVSALAARSGAWAVRVHDVAATRIALGVVSAWEHGEEGSHA